MQVLLSRGVQVIALARADRGARALADVGAEVVRGDLGELGRWEGAAGRADVVFHVALPRMAPPVRGRHVKRAEREAAAGADLIRQASGGRPVVLASCAIAAARGPLRIAAPARAAEAVLAGPGTRIVRLPWAYGPSGFLCDVSRGLQMRRFRMVGPAGNRIALIGALDAAEALVAGAGAPPGTYAVAESAPPTQQELVHHMCAARNAQRPDHLPPRMAAMSMGSVVVEALTADQRVPGDPVPGFTPAQRWDEHMMPALGGG